LIESKFKKIDFAPIVRLHFLAERRPVGTMALLFAAKGFTLPAIESASDLRPIRVLLFERGDIEFALKRENLLEVIRRKRRDAIKYGRSYAPETYADSAEA
jgi:hypothetical protein